MKYLLPLFFSFIFLGKTIAQPQTLELSNLSGSPVTGPHHNSHTLTLYNNTNNPTGNTFSAFTPLTTATFSISNQQFDSIEGNKTVPGLNFGGTTGTGNVVAPAGDFLYQGGVGGPSANNFSSSALNISSGISISATSPTNYAMSVMMYSDALIDTTGANLKPLNAKVYYGDVTITFNRPVNNPIFHIAGLGGDTYKAIDSINWAYLGYAGRLELATGSAYTLSRLSGSTYFSVSDTSVENSSQHMSFQTAGENVYGKIVMPYKSYGASGSFMVNGTGITSVTFRVYLVGDGGVFNGTYTTSNIRWGYTTQTDGERFLMSVDVPLTQSISGAIFNDQNGTTDSIINGDSISVANGQQLYVSLVSGGVIVQTIPVNPDGSYKFTGVVLPNATYNIVLSTLPGGSTVGSIPAGWLNTGEAISPAFQDGANNGVTSVTVGNSDVTGVNFGIRAPLTCGGLIYITQNDDPSNPLVNTIGTVNTSNAQMNALVITNSAGGTNIPALQYSAAVAVNPLNPNQIYYAPTDERGWPSAGPLYLYRYDATTNTSTQLSQISFPGLGAWLVRLAVDGNGVLWTVSQNVTSNNIELFSWTSATGWVDHGIVNLPAGYSWDDLASGDIAFDSRGTMYIIASGGGSPDAAYLFTIDAQQLSSMSGVNAKLVGLMGNNQFNGIAFAADGTLYASGSPDGVITNLYTVNIATGATAVVNQFTRPAATNTPEVVTDLASCVLPTPQLKMYKTVASSTVPVGPGSQLTYRIVVQNIGNLAATNVTLTDLAPAGTTLVTGSTTLNGNTHADYDTTQEVHSPGSLDGNIQPGDSAVITFDVTVNTGFSGSICNSATANYTGGNTITSDDPSLPGSQDSTCVVSINHLPTANTDSTTTSKGTPVTIPVLNNDTFGADGPSTGTIIIINQTKNGIVTVNDGGTPNDPTDDQISYSPNPNFTGKDTAIYQICDANNDCDTAFVIITIDPPLCDFDMNYANVKEQNPTDCSLQNGSITFSGSGIKPNTSYHLTYTWVSNNLSTIVDTIITSTFNGEIIVGNLGTGHIESLTATDTLFGCSSSFQQGHFVSLICPFNNCTDLNFVGSSSNTGVLSGSFVAPPYPTTATIGNNGTDRTNFAFHYQKLAAPRCNNADYYYEANITLNQSDPNDDLDLVMALLKDTTASLTINKIVTPAETTVESNTSSVMVSTNPAKGHVGADILFPSLPVVVFYSSGTYTIRFKPTGAMPNPDSIFLSFLSDHNGGTGVTMAVTINYLKICTSSTNCGPIANTDSTTTGKNIPITIPVLTNDTFGADGPSTEPITITNQPKNGTAIVNNGGTPNDPTDDVITYTPNNNYTGKDTLIYQICDSNGDCDTAMVIINVTVSLPVNLISFSTAVKGTDVNLSWSVAQQISAKEYEILFSTDGTHFNSIGNITATNTSSYSFTHTSPVSGNDYYKIKTINEDGSYSYSSTQIAHVGNKDAHISIMPNPVNSQLHIVTSDMNSIKEIRLMDAAGKLLYINSTEKNGVNMSRYIPGVYMLQIIKSNGEV